MQRSGITQQDYERCKDWPVSATPIRLVCPYCLGRIQKPAAHGSCWQCLILILKGEGPKALLPSLPPSLMLTLREWRDWSDRVIQMTPPEPQAITGRWGAAMTFMSHRGCYERTEWSGSWDNAAKAYEESA